MTQAEFEKEVYDSVIEKYGVKNAFTLYQTAKAKRDKYFGDDGDYLMEDTPWISDTMKFFFDEAFESLWGMSPYEAVKKLATGDWPECKGHWDRNDTIRNQLLEIAVSSKKTEGAMLLAQEIEDYV
jgi:hypothetical protein